MPGTARLEAYFQALTSGNRQVFRDLCASVSFETSEVPDGASAVAHYLDSPSYVTAGAKLLSVRNATVEKFSVGYDGALSVVGGSGTAAFGTLGGRGMNLGNGTLYQNVNYPGCWEFFSGVVIRDGGTLRLQASGYSKTSSDPVIAAEQTWNNGAVTFKALTVDITDTASASGSLLMDLMVASSSMFSVTKAAYVTLGGSGCGLSLGSGGNWIYGAGINLYSGASFSIGNGFPGTGGASMTRPDTDTMALLTGGTERVRITSAGNVGIGTTSPGEQLSLGGYGAIQAVTGNSYGYLTHQYGSDNGSDHLSLAGNFRRTSGSAGTIGTAALGVAEVLVITGGNGSAAGEIRLATGGVGASLADRLTVKWHGDIGIGTSTPDGRLHVASGTLTADTAPVFTGTQTWNNGTIAFTAFKVNVTDTASASGSLLMDLQVGGTSKFAVRKDGRLSIADSLIMTGSAATSYVSSTYAGGAGTISMRITFPDQGSVFDDGIMIGSADQLLISSRAITFGTLVQAWRRNNGTTVAPIAIFSGDSACAFLGGLDASASLLLYGSAGYNPYSVGLVASSGGRLFFWFHQSIANNDFEIGLRGTGFSGWSDRVTAGYGENYILSFESDIRDAANAVSFGFRSKTTLSTAGACLLAAYNNTTLKFSVDKDGNVAAAGTLKFGTHSAIGAETVTGYVTITDAAGNSRKLAVVS